MIFLLMNELVMMVFYVALIGGVVWLKWAKWMLCKMRNQEMMYIGVAISLVIVAIGTAYYMNFIWVPPEHVISQCVGCRY